MGHTSNMALLALFVTAFALFGLGAAAPNATHHGDGVYSFSGGDVSIGTDRWKLVRRVQPGNTWHPADDNLTGTAIFGNYNTSLVHDSTFSIKFDNIPCSQFLFITGDNEKWLIAEADQVYGDGNYSNANRTILRSSISNTTYNAKWYNRNSDSRDPWISLEDLDVSVTNGGILYGENATTDFNDVLAVNNGANVFCKVKEEPPKKNSWAAAFFGATGAVAFIGGCGVLAARRREILALLMDACKGTSKGEPEETEMSPVVYGGGSGTDDLKLGADQV